MTTIAKRSLLYCRTRSGERIQVLASVDAPQDNHRDDQVCMSVCAVTTEDADGLMKTEFVGVDSYHALSLAVAHITAFLARLAATGHLYWPDGTEYQVDQDGIFSKENDILREVFAVLKQRKSD